MQVGHGDELTLIFHMEKFPLRQRWSENDFKGGLIIFFILIKVEMNLNDNLISVSTRLLKMWTNFAKSSNPTPEGDSDLDFK